jgi:hypothetical protein
LSAEISVLEKLGTRIRTAQKMDENVGKAWHSNFKDAQVDAGNRA